MPEKETLARVSCTMETTMSCIPRKWRYWLLCSLGWCCVVVWTTNNLRWLSVITNLQDNGRESTQKSVVALWATGNGNFQHHRFSYLKHPFVSPESLAVPCITWKLSIPTSEGLTLLQQREGFMTINPTMKGEVTDAACTCCSSNLPSGQWVLVLYHSGQNERKL